MKYVGTERKLPEDPCQTWWKNAKAAEGKRRAKGNAFWEVDMSRQVQGKTKGERGVGEASDGETPAMFPGEYEKRDTRDSETLSSTSTKWRILLWAGRLGCLLGAVLLLSVLYNLWGTRVYTWRVQNTLRDTFAAQQENEALVKSTTDAALTFRKTQEQAVLSGLVEQLRVERTTAEKSGGPVARLRIPRLEVDAIVVAGTSRAALRKGPGLLEGTVLPGLPGNAVISGHRTTYGAEFNRLDELQSGDEIFVESLMGETLYRVREARIVAPEDVWVAEPTAQGQLTLTTCHPEFSARQRYIIFADLVDGPLAALDSATLHELLGDASSSQGFSGALPGELLGEKTAT